MLQIPRCKRIWGGAPVRQTGFFIDASEFEGREGGARTIILHGRFTVKLSCLRTRWLYPRNLYLTPAWKRDRKVGGDTAVSAAHVAFGVLELGRQGPTGFRISEGIVRAGAELSLSRVIWPGASSDVIARFAILGVRRDRSAYKEHECGASSYRISESKIFNREYTVGARTYAHVRAISINLQKQSAGEKKNNSESP